MHHQTHDVSRRQPCDAAPVDLLDRVLGGGVVVSSDLTVAIADVDLMRVRLGDVLRALSAAERGEWA